MKKITNYFGLFFLMVLLKSILFVLGIIDLIIEWFRDATIQDWKYRFQAFGAILFFLFISGFGGNIIYQASHSPDPTTVWVIRGIGLIMVFAGIFLGMSLFPKKTSSNTYYCGYPYSR